MGAKCSRNSKCSSYTMTFSGVDMYDRLQVFNFLKIRPGEVAKRLQTIAWMVEEVSLNLSSSFGGRSPMRPILQTYYKNTDGLVFVVDSSCEAKLEDGLNKLDEHILKDDDTKNMVIMVLANKQDEEGALSMKQIENKVGEILSNHDSKLDGRTLFLRGCNSETKMGVEEAFSQFTQIIQLHKGGQKMPGLQTYTGEELNAFGKKDNNSRLHSLKKMFDMSYMKSVLLY